MRFFLTKKKFKKCPTIGKRLNRPYTKSDFTADEGKERPNPFREKNQGKHRRRKADEKSCVTFLLCDPGWYVHKPDVQNKWDDSTPPTHTLLLFLVCVCVCFLPIHSGLQWTYQPGLGNEKAVRSGPTSLD